MLVIHHALQMKEKKIKTFNDPVSGGWWKKTQANGIVKVNEGNLQSRMFSRTSEGKKIKPSKWKSNVPVEQGKEKSKTFKERMEGTLQCRRKPSR